ncbi:N-terminal 7TM region of histidine kinase [Paenibacillus sp. UNCCL117]|uniref:sensor histidine kinase n=1 Tax=unclassified Paenibacillus TaxID=185978 RepID=UPI00087F3715|nr:MULTISPECIES: ATP-binding protein [unclassified Paenibacillus]SDD70399.1 N-terminal 7TM region of histidine kinase [Paenibacillus sp. cl123]SFW45330.1 N-terminal 7TM region of histidine kinase [Paenibacillus sp. UNCCL117]
MNPLTELVVMIASVIMSVIILFYVYGFRNERGIRYLIGVIVCRIIYAIGVISEKYSYAWTEKLIFRNVQDTALNLMVPFVLLFALHLTGRDKPLSPRRETMLIVTFACVSLLFWFDPVLHVMFRTTLLEDGHLIRVKTGYSIALSIVSYLIVVTGIYFLFQYVRNIRSDLRKPGMWVLLLASFPFIIQVVKFVKPEWSSWLSLLSIFCGFTGMLMLVITWRIKFFSIVPFARNMVLDTLQESILIAKASGKIIDSNKQASEWFSKLGYGAVDGREIAELLEPWPEWHQLCQSMQQGNVEIEAWLDGERRMYSVNVYPLHTFRRQGQGSISLIFDITEKQRHLEQIAQLNQLKDQLFTIVSHDIRTPIAMQFQLVEMLEEDKERFEAEHREIIDMLGGQIRNTLGMATNLLEWFRSQRADAALYPQFLELSQVVEECCHALHINSEAKQIMVKHTIPSGTYVYADREVLGLIIRNLLSNAIKFTEAGGLVQVYAELSGDKAVVSVRDNGVGMEEEQVRRLFEGELLQSLPGTSGEKGTGLGLLVSRQFVQRSGGRLWAESQAGQGSVFHFTLRGEHRNESSCR